MQPKTITLTPEELTTIGRFAAGHITREEAENLIDASGRQRFPSSRLDPATGRIAGIAETLDCVDFRGLEVSRP